ncbi:MAG: hypothetical protein H6704_18775 [Myxococcales bacterium]|nr:hypothetical protein [Myxococcales bacterium]
MQLCCSGRPELEVAVPPPLAPVADRLRALLGAACVVAVGLVLVGNLGTLAHLGLVAHAPGADGMVHVDCTMTAPPPADTGLGNAVDGHGHDGCHLSQAERPSVDVPLPGAALSARQPAVALAPPGLPPATPRAARALYRLAPKQSPPA